MAVLPVDVLSKFVKITNDDSSKTKTESTVYGTLVEDAGVKYVKIDGSDLLTPVRYTAIAGHGERVLVMIKNHTAVVTGNLSAPSIRNIDLTDFGEELTNDITNFEGIVTDKLVANDALINDLKAENVTINGILIANEAEIEDLKVENATITDKLTANEAEINDLKAENVVVNGKLTANEAEIEDLRAENVTVNGKLDANEADINNLKAENVDISGKLTANEAEIKKLDVEKLSAESADLKYANIDFANIDYAAIENLYAKSGIIENLTISEGTVTGKLVGVTIVGDLIEGGTVVADKLVVLGEDGLYYKLNTDGMKVEAEQTEYNSIHGSIITAESITASKITVDDLVAFNATIGGFNLTDSAIYSGVKESVDNTTRGIYLDKTGQIAFGDTNNFVKFFKDTDGSYKLAISADSILFGTNKQTIQSAIDTTVEGAIAESEERTSTQISLTKDEIELSIEKKVDSNGLKTYLRLEDEGVYVGKNASNAEVLVNAEDACVDILINKTPRSRFAATFIQFGNMRISTPSVGGLIIQVADPLS